MHPDFARWYGEVSMDGTGRAERWSGIEKLASDPDGTLVEVLVRLAFGTKAPPSGNKEPRLAEKLAVFHAAFHNDDEPYDATAAREVQVLAASALVHLFGSYPLAPLAVATAAAAGARKPDLPMNLTGLAETAIRMLGDARRIRPKLSELEAELVEIPSTTSDVIEDLRTSVEKAVQTMAERLNFSMQQMGSYIQVADEELQMLWWLVNGFSQDLGLPFEKVGAAARPLVFGKELADRTAEPPGPVAIGALLSRAGLKSNGKVGIISAIGALDDSWVTDAVRDVDASPVTSPIHFALEKRVETGAGNAWVAGWAAIAGLPEDLGAAPSVLGKLFYRERLLLKSGS
jgi:hypothetical protein